ncbi:MAG: hypothetical protein MRQ09_05890 [Candidatus Midichloria sp.]|nr:hypothetical protein [Candidatus Midichloria sp.]
MVNRLIKIAIDRDGKETKAATVLIQAFEAAGEEGLRGALVRLEAAQEIKEQQVLEDTISSECTIFCSY